MGGQFSCLNIGGNLKCIGKYSERLNDMPDGLQTNFKLFSAGYVHICADKENIMKINSTAIDSITEI